MSSVQTEQTCPRCGNKNADAYFDKRYHDDDGRCFRGHWYEVQCLECGYLETDYPINHQTPPSPTMVIQDLELVNKIRVELEMEPLEKYPNL